MDRQLNVERLLRHPVPLAFCRPAVLFPVLLMAIVLLRVRERSLPTPDFRVGTAWYSSAHAWVMTVLWFLGLSIVVMLARFLLIWKNVRLLLRDYLQAPMVRAYDRIPPVFSRQMGRYLDHWRPSLSMLAIPVQQWALVAERFERCSAEIKKRYLNPHELIERDEKNAPRDPAQIWSDIERRLQPRVNEGTEDAADLNIKGAYEEELSAATFRRPRTGDQFLLSHDDLASSRSWKGLRSAARACFDILDAFWCSREPGVGYGETQVETRGENEKKETEQKTKAEKALDEWVESAENLVALVTVTRASHFMIHLRNLAVYLAIAPVLLLLTVTSYPFQPQRFMLVCCWSILLAVVGSVVWVYIQMERNEFLSRVSRTTPNHIAVDSTFLSNILSFLIPLVGAVLTQFPFVSDTLNQWMEPISRVLK
jgi:hypothetical protein